VAPAALLARTLSNARLETFKGCGYMAPATHPEPVNAAIERFLDEVSG
jgi:pimeloyl-ACP methyl ester carboxylesterase